MTLRVRYIANTIMENVSSGKVADLFAKPINYLLYRSYWQIGQGLYSFFLILILGVAVLVPTIGVPETINGFFFISFFTIFFTSLILGFFLYMIVGLLAFWIEDVKPIFWIVDKMVMILGGSYIPVALFPEAVYKFAVWSPFGASQFITHTVYDSWRSNFFKFFGIQIFWIVILGIVVYVLFRKAHKRVSVNGG
jgi:ABC-2 type transport system permease protein